MIWAILCAIVLVGGVALASYISRRRAGRNLLAAGAARSEARDLGEKADRLETAAAAQPVVEAREDATDVDVASSAAAEAALEAETLPAPVGGVIGGSRPRSSLLEPDE